MGKVEKYLRCPGHAGPDNLDKRDAPGQLLKWLLEIGEQIYAYSVEQRFDVGNLKQYLEADAYFRDAATAPGSSTGSLAGAAGEGSSVKTVTIKCPARAALCGNPSDGFGGKTFSIPVRNFEATVTVKSNSNNRIEFASNDKFDLASYGNANELLASV